MADSIDRTDTQRKALVSDVAHELRTPLANVRSHLEAAQDGVVPLDPALVRSLIEESALLERLVADLHDLALADTGSGIAPEHLPHIFDRRYRADPSRSRTTGDSGLGLAITKHLVEAHHGHLDVTSTPGTGSTFTIRLPRRPTGDRGGRAC